MAFDTQLVKKNRDPRWEEEFQFTLEEPPTNDRLHVEVVSASSRIGLLHPKVYDLHESFWFHFNFWNNPLVSFYHSMESLLISFFFPLIMIFIQEILGYVDINLADVVNNKRINEKYHLIDSRNGRIQIELQWRTS